MYQMLRNNNFRDHGQRSSNQISICSCTCLEPSYVVLCLSDGILFPRKGVEVNVPIVVNSAQPCHKLEGGHGVDGAKGQAVFGSQPHMGIIELHSREQSSTSDAYIRSIAYRVQP